MKKIDIQVIGEVQSAENGFAIELREPFREALTGIDGFSHLNIIWWADQVDDVEQRKVLLVDKPYKQGPEKLGIFATRSPLRPNPIAITVVSVTSIDLPRGMIYMPYIDAEPGTPVLDIKIYLPCCEIVENYSVPAWCRSFPASIEESADFDWSTVFNFAY